MGGNYSKVELKDLTLGDEVGKGAFGTTVKASHKTTKATYAVKMTSLLTSDAIKRAGDEHKHLLQITGHVNVTQFFAFAIHGETACIVMEYCEGGNLNDYCLKHWPGEKEAQQFCSQVAKGLAHIHSKQIVHGDLKPDNILINKGVCKISDMGLAKAFQDIMGIDAFAITSAEKFTATNGIPVFWAPEVVQLIMNKQKIAITPKCDVFSLGLIALVLFTKQVLYFDKSKGEMVAPLNRGEPYGCCTQDEINAAVTRSGAPDYVQNVLLDMLQVPSDKRASAAKASGSLSGRWWCTVQ